MSGFSRFLGLTIVAVALATATGYAQAPGRPAGPRGQRFLAGLNLTDAQRDQIHALRDQNRTAMREQVQQLGDARRGLRQETFAEAPDQAKIDALQQEVTALSHQLEARRLDLQQRIAQILTPEQRQYMREHQQQIRNFRAQRMMRRGRV